jgi:hypothetical protein
LQVRPDMLRRLHKEMKAAGQVICIGRGRGAKWQKRKESHYWQIGRDILLQQIYIKIDPSC